MEISNYGISLEFNDKTGIATLKSGNICFTQCESREFELLNAKKDSNRIILSLKSDKIAIECKYEICSDDTGKYIKCTLSGEGEFEGYAKYPEAFDVKRGDRQIDPYCEGYAFNVEDECPYLVTRPLYAGSWNSMAFWSLENKTGWLMSVVYTSYDATLITERCDDGLCRTNIAWEPHMGSWQSDRVLRFYLGSGNSITEMCRIYRKIVIEKGYVKTLKQKAQENPKVDKTAGSANLWLWNSDAMHKLYDGNAVYTVPSAEQTKLRRDIADEMKSLGITDMMWSIFDENIDTETVEHVKSLGYVTSHYDVYTDVISKDSADKIPETRRRRCEQRMPYWPNGIIVQKNGELYPAWELMGTDGVMHPQHRMCDICAVDCAKGFVPKHCLANGIEGILIDVTLCCALECYSENHRASREVDWDYKNKLFELMGEYGLVRGCENGHEDAVKNYEYSEGKMSLSLSRLEDAGRRMATVYEDKKSAEYLKKFMLDYKCRVPLWELVFHDCETSYWYWGDSTNSCPEVMPLRDLMCSLYGLPPIYSFSVDNWDKLKDGVLDSYNKTVPLARRLRYCTMDSFEYLTDDKSVQKTTFSDGTQVIANFGKTDYTYNGKTVKAEDKLVVFK